MIAARHLLVVCSYALLSLVVTYPLIGHFGSATLGPHYADRMQNEWNLWWVQTALLTRHSNPFHTDLLFYPQGTDLYFHALDLPLTLLALPFALLFGLPAGYNSSVILALTLAGYAGWRLAAYVTGQPLAAFCGGLIIGFNPLSAEMIQGQTNIVNLGWCVLCLEFYLRAWAGGRRRDAVLAGLAFALAVLTVGYYESYLLLAFALDGLWRLWTWRRTRSSVSTPRAAVGGSRAVRVLLWAGGAALLVAGPYVAAAWWSAQSGLVAPFTDVDAGQPLHNSADLLSFLLPSHTGLLLGAGTPWWAAVNPAIHDFLWLGPVTLGLAALGGWVGRRAAGVNSKLRTPNSALFWLVLALIGLILALGPVLQVGGAPVAGGAVPLPFSVLRLVPPFSLLRVPYRFSTLAWIGLGVAASGGVAVLLGRLRGPRRIALGSGLAALLIAQMPLHSQPLRDAGVPAALAAPAADPAPGALIELPFTQHGGLDAARMLYQTAHGRPIAAGYLSRTVADPYVDACSPFAALRAYPDLPARDIVTPTAGSLLPGILAGQGAGFLAVYKSRSADPANGDPLPPDQLGPLQSLAARLGTPLADDATATTYRLRPAAAPPRYLQLGGGWYDPERRAGRLFRWLADPEADVCVFSPAAAVGRLTFQAAAFAVPRRLEVWAGDHLLLAAIVPADGTLHPLTTPAFAWPAGPQAVLLRVAAAGASPAGGGGTDARVLRVGLAELGWVPAAP